MSKGDEDLGGYHLIWPRDFAQIAGGLLAFGAHDECCVSSATCGRSGGGRKLAAELLARRHAYWNGVQMDECAFPILLLDMAWREGAFAAGSAGLLADGLDGPRDMSSATGRARARIAGRRMPATRRSRSPCRSPRCSLPLIWPTRNIDDVADFLRDTADVWNEQIEDWVYVTDTRLTREIGVAGYYVRIAPEVPGDARAELRGIGRSPQSLAEASHVEADELISTDALALVRFGLRSPDDPRIIDTVKVIDPLLCVDLPYGPGWRRYNGDGYGEHEDGGPYDGTGVGRVWPLLTGERAHYELAAGRRAEAERLLAALEAGASPGQLLPEQVWDGAPIPERELFPGQPSGSAMPLVWAHAEHVKLLRRSRTARLRPAAAAVRRYLRRSM